MANEKDIEIKTEAVNELLTAIPSWLIRWGVSIVFGVILLLVVLSYFIKYPDVLSAKTIITNINPPVTLIAKTNGKIMALKISNNQLVKKGQVLLVIENPADYTDVNSVSILIERLSARTASKALNNLSSYTNLRLGELTTSFIVFLRSYNDYSLQLDLTPQAKEIGIIDKELLEYDRLQGKYQNQEDIYKEEFLLIEKDYNRYRSLLQSQSVSIKEFEDKQKEFLSAKRNYENIKITNINNRLAINSLEKNKLQLEMKAYEELKRFEQALEQSIQNLRSQIYNWEQTYLLKAPLDGKISLFNYWAINQNLKLGDEILSIVPVEKQEVIARLFLPVKNSGKLKEGQRVNIKLNNYQFQEYGMLKGFVKHISLMPQKESYAIEVTLPGRLMTSYKKTLAYKEEMEGMADIITEDLSVFDRIFHQFRKIIN